MTTYAEQNNQAYKSYLDRIFFNNNSNELPSIEIILTSNCDLKCEYCYLQRFEDNLYPKEYRDPKLILNNASIFLDWMLEKKIKFELQVFSGEVFSQKLGYDFFDLLYNKIKHFSKEEQLIPYIIIPTNMSFIASDILTEKVQNILDKFRVIGTIISLSASVDGKCIEEYRPYKNKEEDRRDEYYDKLFIFGKKNHIGFHPMIAASNASKWIENFKWYMGMMEKHGLYTKRKIKRLLPPMMLEVRNDDWTEEAIQEYLKFLDFLVDYEFKDEFEDKKFFARRVFLGQVGRSYDTIALYPRTGGRDKISCGIQRAFYVRLGDLAIVACHRTAYDHFKLGQFVIEDNKIVDIESTNLPLTLSIMSTISRNLPQCEKCSIKHYCIKGCLGSQYEITGELFQPIESVCNLFKAKVEFLIKKYHEMGILKEAVLILPDDITKLLIELIKELGLDERINL